MGSPEGGGLAGGRGGGTISAQFCPVDQAWRHKSKQNFRSVLPCRSGPAPQIRAEFPLSSALSIRPGATNPGRISAGVFSVGGSLLDSGSGIIINGMIDLIDVFRRRVKHSHLESERRVPEMPSRRDRARTSGLGSSHTVSDPMARALGSAEVPGHHPGTSQRANGHARMRPGPGSPIRGARPEFLECISGVPWLCVARRKTFRCTIPELRVACPGDARACRACGKPSGLVTRNLRDGAPDNFPAHFAFPRAP